MNFGELTEMIRKDTRLKIILTAATLIQVIICVTSIGIYHPDQYFQIIEFSSHQLHRPDALRYIWEFKSHLRSTFQVYLFSGYYEMCIGVGIHDPYVQLTILRVIFGLALFVFFNGITLYYFRKEDRRILYFVLILLDFTWILPYTRTLFSSEMLSSVIFFGALFLYQFGRRSWWMALLTGFLFSLAFYARFQTAFAIIGFVVWMFWPARRQGDIWLLAIGFLAGVLMNTALDYGFYHRWVFTPWIYYEVNIVEGKAAQAGTASVLLYLAVLAAMVLTPPLSLFLLFSGFRAAFLRKLSDPLVLSVVFFILGHCVIAHKEERFLFPVLNVLPIIVGWGLPDLIAWVRSRRTGVRGLMKGMMYFSIGLNVFLLVVLLFTPYSQQIYFTWQLRQHFKDSPTTIYTLGRTPFETPHHLPFVFYRQASPNLHWMPVVHNDSLRDMRDRPEYVTTTYNQIDGHHELLDSLGYEQVICSSRLLWGINEWLHSMKINTIDDIWVLYKKK